MSDADDLQSESFHATTVAVGENAVMIVGPSGSGKSSLALELIGMGALLVSDDLSKVVVNAEEPVVVAPDKMQGVIEARGLGLINVPSTPKATLKLIVDMSENELERLPRSRQITTVAGCAVELVLRVDAPYFASALYNLLRHGRYDEAK